MFGRGNSQRDGLSVDLNTLNPLSYPLSSEGQRSLIERTASDRLGQVNSLSGQSLGGAGRIISP